MFEFQLIALTAQPHNDVLLINAQCQPITCVKRRCGD